MDRDRPDVLGDDPDDPFDTDDDDRTDSATATVVQAVTAPEALALASLVLAGVSLLGVGLLNGSAYMPPSLSPTGSPDRSVLVLTALLGAVLALIPVALGAVALRRLPLDSPSRITAGAGVLLAALSVVLRLAVAARTAADENTPWVQF